MVSQSQWGSMPSTIDSIGDGLGADHGQHRALAEVGLDRGEAEAAVAQHHRGDAVPAGDRAVRVPADLGVVVGVQVDEAGRDDQARRRR